MLLEEKDSVIDALRAQLRAAGISAPSRDASPPRRTASQPHHAPPPHAPHRGGLASAAFGGAGVLVPQAAGILGPSALHGTSSAGPSSRGVSRSTSTADVPGGSPAGGSSPRLDLQQPLQPPPAAATRAPHFSPTGSDGGAAAAAAAAMHGTDSSQHAPHHYAPAIPPPLSLPLSTLRLSADEFVVSPVGAADGPGAARRRLTEAEAAAKQWKAAYEEADRRLRHAMEEVSRLEGVGQITDRDALYLRSVIVSGFEAGELPREGSMYGVLSRLLHFTGQEVERIQQHAAARAARGPKGRGAAAARPAAAR
jgi:hypothetical protein